MRGNVSSELLCACCVCESSEPAVGRTEALSAQGWHWGLTFSQGSQQDLWIWNPLGWSELLHSEKSVPVSGIW